MAKTKVIKMCDLSGDIAARVFSMLNPGKIELKKKGAYTVIVTDTEPDELVYPEGWYYGCGTFRNKHTSTTGVYSELLMVMSDGTEWELEATYCTLSPID